MRPEGPWQRRAFLYNLFLPRTSLRCHSEVISYPKLGYTHTNFFVPSRLHPVRSSPSANCHGFGVPGTPPPQPSVTVPVGGDASKKRALSGPLRPPPDVHMNDAEAEAIAHQLAPDCTPAFNPDNVIPDLISFVSRTLSCASNSVSPSGSYVDPLLVQSALAKKLEDIHATILSVKAKADHAQQVASSALNIASAAASASRTYAQTAAAAAPPKPPPSQNPRPAGKAPGAPV